MAVKIKEALRKAAVEIEKAGAYSPLLDAEVLLCYVLNKDRLYLVLNKEEPLTEQQEKSFQSLIRQRIEGVPVQYLTNHQEFMGLDFYVEPGVLIPRPDTEILVEEVIQWAKKRSEENFKIADIGTGSGAISVSLAKYISQALVYSVDISPKALKVGRKNAQLQGVEKKIKFLQGDMLEPLKELSLENQLDALVSNPPYIPSQDISGLQKEVAKYEPRLALDGGEDGLDYYRELVKKAPLFLKQGGLLALEVGHDQARMVEKLIERRGLYKDIQITKDLAGIERVITANLWK